jgi:hypothetical protein
MLDYLGREQVCFNLERAVRNYHKLSGVTLPEEA